MRILKYIYTKLLAAFEQLLIKTDEDYHRWLQYVEFAHSRELYWEFVQLRRDEEQNPDPKSGFAIHDRWDSDFYKRCAQAEEEHNHPEEDFQGDEFVETELNQAEGFLGLVSGTYTRAEFIKAKRRMVKIAHPDRGGSSELFVLVSEACQTIERHHQWA